MKDDIRFVHQFGQKPAVHYTFEKTVNIRIGAQVADIFDRSRAQIIQQDDLLSSSNQDFRQM